MLRTDPDLPPLAATGTQPAAKIGTGDRLALTVFLAIAVHAMIILGISFDFDRGNSEEILNTLDVTLVQQKSDQPAEDADYLAQEQQRGGGNTQERTRPQSDSTPNPQAEYTSQAPTSTPATAPAARPAPRAEVLTRRQSEQQVAAGPPVPEAAPAPQISAAQLIQRSREIARLEARIETSEQIYSRRPDPKFLTANTRKAEDAAYLHAWTQKVESIGNLNYPDEARRRQLSGKLRLEVTLRPNGSLVEVRLLESSGSQILDEAARRIVRLAAPFAPVPTGVLGDRSELRIVRTWVFTSAHQLTSH